MHRGRIGLGKELDVDSTDIEANASIDSLRPRFAVAAHLARLFQEQDEDSDDDPGGEPGHRTCRSR